MPHILLSFIDALVFDIFVLLDFSVALNEILYTGDTGFNFASEFGN